jgi:hypothetical protein
MLYADAVLKIARSQLGVCEHPAGSNSGPQVERYQAATTLHGTGWPWCDAFVAWCFRQAGLPLKDSTASTVQSLHDAIRAHTVVAKPFPGCIALFDFPGGDEVDHTGIVESVHPGYVVCIEGNTSADSAGSQSNGGCVARKNRPLATVRAFYKVPGVRKAVPVRKRPAVHAKAVRYHIVNRLFKGRWYTTVEPAR